MSVVVVQIAQVRPGRVEELVAQSERAFRDRAGLAASRRQAWYFQGLDDPELFLYVGEWDSREAFESYARERHAPGFEDLFVCWPQYRYCRALGYYERVMERVGAVGSFLLQTRPEAAPALVAELERMGREEVRPRAPGLLGYYIYGDLGDPGRLMVVHTWATVENLQRVRAAQAGEWFARLRAQGAQATLFNGVTRAAFPAPS
jgi:quinol monooxygenase YgiN